VRTRPVRVVEPGALELRFARSSASAVFTAGFTLTGRVRTVDHTRALRSEVEVSRTPTLAAL